MLCLLELGLTSRSMCSIGIVNCRVFCTLWRRIMNRNPGTLPLVMHIAFLRSICNVFFSRVEWTTYSYWKVFVSHFKSSHLRKEPLFLALPIGPATPRYSFCPMFLKRRILEFMICEDYIV